MTITALLPSPHGPKNRQRDLAARLKQALRLGLLFGTVGIVGTATAESVAEFPSHKVTIYVPFSAGSAIDMVTRLCAEKLTTKFGQSFVVINEGGGSGLIGSAKVAQSPPDGYTLLASSAATITIAPFAFKKMPYDPVADLTPITTTAESPIVVAVSEVFPAKTLGELIELAKKSPGKLTFASGGASTLATVAAGVFQMKTGVRLAEIDYRGMAAAVPDFVAGRVDVAFPAYPAVQALVQAGKVRLLAAATASRSPLIKEAVPTAAEAGLDGYVVSAWDGLMGPHGMPPELVEKINAAVTEALKEPDTVKRMAQMGLTPIPSTSAEFATRIKEQTAELKALSKFMNMVSN